MNRISLVALGLVILAVQMSTLAQVRNEGLADQIIAARQKHSAMMKQYSWNCQAVLIENGNIKDTRIDAVSYGPDGNIQRVVLNDQQASLPGGFLRRAMAENQRKEIDKYF